MECQGKMPRAVTRKAESTDVHVCGGLPRSSVEVSVMGMEQQAPVISETNKIDTNFVPHLHFLGNYAMIRNTLPGQKGGPYEENFCAYVGHCHGADHGGLRQESRQ